MRRRGWMIALALAASAVAQRGFAVEGAPYLLSTEGRVCGRPGRRLRRGGGFRPKRCGTTPAP